MRHLEWTRRVPGPLYLITFVWIALAGVSLHAHDPGLSSLDVSVRSDSIAVTLAMSAPDVALVAPSGDARHGMTRLALDAIRLTVDGVAVHGAVDAVTLDDGAVRVLLTFPIASSSGVRRIEIASAVPGRVARGHRELLAVAANDRVLSERLLDSQSGPVTIDVEAATPSVLGIAARYVELGIHHILSGYDHLVFLAGLLLSARKMRELVVALTAFTAAHSVSLALVVVAGVHAPPSIVEPLIAASIAWVGLESLLYGQAGARWLIVFGFGLIHGFGFAGALMELGLGSSAAEIAVALLSFNVGVEAGQLAAAGAMLPVVWAIGSRPQWRARLLPVCSLMIAIAGGFWLIERLS